MTAAVLTQRLVDVGRLGLGVPLLIVAVSVVSGGPPFHPAAVVLFQSRLPPPHV